MLFPTDDAGHALAERFRAFIENQQFPCVGAKAALTRGHMRVVVASEMGSGRDDARIHAALMAFVCRYRELPDLFQSFVVLFEGPDTLSEEAFERRLWERVQSLSDRDGYLGHVHDVRVARDPEDPHFSLSFAGEGFFVVGLHPRASREARRFDVPALVFNPHDQFERLRTDGRYERMRDTIRARDIAWTGSSNPMLTTHGERSEAAQYSGRAVPDSWTCPFRSAEPMRPFDKGDGKVDLRGGAFSTMPAELEPTE